MRLGVVVGIAGAVLAIAGASVADELRDEVVAATLTTYVHGIDAEIAHSEVGTEGVPVLHQLLGDPTFPRRDNVIAFLTYLGDNDSARALNDFLRNPPARPERAEEDRALLLAPHALGEMAARGNSLALRVLMTATRDQSKGGVLAAAAARAPLPESMRDDLLEMAVRGLAHSGRKGAEGRLKAIAEGHAVPAPGGRQLGRIARASLQALEDARRPQRARRPGVYDSDETTGAVPFSATAPEARPSSADATGGAAGLADIMLHSSALDYANHVSHPSPMTDARLDEILADASLRAAREDFGGDNACCVQFHRQGTAQTFGTPGDGLDIIDNDLDMYGALAYEATRVKVVRLINWCGTPGTNFIGCGFIGGYGTVVARYSDMASEGALWVHEYGHNVGLGHNSSDWQLIMYPVISRNSGLTATECAQFHAPAAATRAEITEVGRCVLDNLEEGFCGDGIATGGEECDDDDLRGQACSDLGFDAGVLGCNSDCTVDSAGCSVCGNGVREGGEECDGSDLGGVTCGDHRCRAGAPTCTASCRLDATTCRGCQPCESDGIGPGGRPKTRALTSPECSRYRRRMPAHHLNN